MPYIRLAQTETIAAHSSLAVEYDGQKLLVCNARDQFFVIENKCSHAEEPLDCGRIRNGWIACPVHGARFALDNGEALNPPASRPIKTFAVQVVDGWVEADFEPSAL